MNGRYPDLPRFIGEQLAKPIVFVRQVHTINHKYVHSVCYNCFIS